MPKVAGGGSFVVREPKNKGWFDINQRQIDAFIPENDIEIKMLHEYYVGTGLKGYDDGIKHVLRMRALRQLMEAGRNYRSPAR